MRYNRAGYKTGLCKDQSGSVAVIFGLSAMVLLALIGGGIDYARLANRRSHLQNAADAGVLAAGNTLKLALSNAATVSSVTEQTIHDQAKPFSDSPYSLNIKVSDDKSSVSAEINEKFKFSFAPFIGVKSANLSVRSKVSLVGKMRLCMLTLDPLSAGAFSLKDHSQIWAEGCTLYSDSANAAGMIGDQNAIARAETICSAGGVASPRGNFTPSPQTGCPKLTDPLANRVAPAPSQCAELPYPYNGRNPQHLPALNIIDRTVNLEPGTYCGGLHITGNAKINLKPGTYVMKDGPLIVDMYASLEAMDVSFYFTGDASGLLFDRFTTISLAAPTTGAMAGILMSEDKTISNPIDLTKFVTSPSGQPLSPTPKADQISFPMRLYRIVSNNAHNLLGTLYLPVGRVVIDAGAHIAQDSAYTVIIAGQLNISGSPSLHLNSNYSGTSVPVPKGVGPRQGHLQLTQ